MYVVWSRAPSPSMTSRFLSFFESALPEVYGYLLHRCHDKTVAEDVTSETLLAAVQGIHARHPNPWRRAG